MIFLTLYNLTKTDMDFYLSDTSCSLLSTLLKSPTTTSNFKMWIDDWFIMNNLIWIHNNIPYFIKVTLLHTYVQS